MSRKQFWIAFAIVIVLFIAGVIFIVTTGEDSAAADVAEIAGGKS